MPLQPREKKLAAVVAGLAVVLGAWYVVDGVRTAFDRRTIQLEAAQRDLRQKRLQAARAAVAVERLADHQRRSLPRDRELARSLYQNWLAATLDDAGLEQVQVDPGRPTVVRDNYAKLPYAVRAQGSLERVGRWLAMFYRAGHLHQIRDLSLQPLGGGAGLQMTATIEAASLVDADARDRLATSNVGPLDEARAAEAVKTISTRNWFAAYVPPPPPKPPAPPTSAPPPPPKPVFDEAKFAVLTSIIFVDAKPQAWVNVRPTKQLLRLQEGDGIEVGQFRGKLVRIGAQEIEVEQDGKRRTVALGKSLAQGVESPSSGS